jgi:HprK-related kinase B
MKLDNVLIATASAEKIAKEISVKFPVTTEIQLNFGNCPIRVISNSQYLLTKLDRYFTGFVSAKPFEFSSADNIVEIVGKSSYKKDILIFAIESEEIDFTSSFGVQFSLKHPDPGKTKIKEEFTDLPDGRIVRKIITGMHFLFGDFYHIAIGPCNENDNQIINFINNRFIQFLLNRGALLGHAAAIYHNGCGVSMAGFSGAGKSTLALHCMSRGVTFVSNDRLMIRPENSELIMYGVAKLPRINPGTILNNKDLHPILSEEEKQKFLSLPPDELWALEHKFDAYIDDLFGADKFILRAPKKALVLLNWKRISESPLINKINLREKPELLAAFKKDTGLFYQDESDLTVPDFSDEAYFQMLDNTDIIEISGGIDFDKAADAVVEYMNTGRI